MKEPYGEGLASHIGPESCGGGSNGAAEALTEVRAGQVLSREMLFIPGCRQSGSVGRQHLAYRRRETRRPCAVEDLSTYGNTLHGNGEILCSPLGEGPEAVLGSRRA